MVSEMHSNLPKFWRSPKRRGKNMKKSFSDVRVTLLARPSPNPRSVWVQFVSFGHNKKGGVWLSATVDYGRIQPTVVYKGSAQT
jgi:hypothetical protein